MQTSYSIRFVSSTSYRENISGPVMLLIRPEKDDCAGTVTGPLLDL